MEGQRSAINFWSTRPELQLIVPLEARIKWNEMMVTEMQSNIDLLGLTWKQLFPLKLSFNEMRLRISEMQSSDDLLLI